MASRRGSGSAGTTPAEQTATADESTAVPVADEPHVDEQLSVAEAAAIEGSDTVTDYTRRAGGYVLTDRGWVIEQTEDSED